MIGKLFCQQTLNPEGPNHVAALARYRARGLGHLGRFAQSRALRLRQPRLLGKLALPHQGGQRRLAVSRCPFAARFHQHHNLAA